MFETGRRSAISSSELGLYSDRSDYYNRSKYGPVVKKFVIGVMAVVAVILAAIFIYDFASGAASSSKVSQETKHVYILQNALRKPAYLSRRAASTPNTASTSNTSNSSSTSAPEAQLLSLTSPTPSAISSMQERSDDGDLSFINLSAKEEDEFYDDPEIRGQSLANYKMRSRMLKNKDNKNDKIDKIENKQLFNNHAIVYRVRQMYKHPDPGDLYKQESRPKPFHFELKTPHPTSFKKVKYPQLTQYQYPHNSRSIQDIIKYLSNDPESTKHGIKFAGVYMNPKKYDLYSDITDMMNDDQTDLTDVFDDMEEEEEGGEEEDASSYTVTHHDPFYQYRPKHPADVNLLAPANVRFASPSINRYNSYLDPPYHRPLLMMNRPVISTEPSITYDNSGAYSASFGNKKKKPKPFSVMLDIYPLSDMNDNPANKIALRPKPPSALMPPMGVSVPVPLPMGVSIPVGLPMGVSAPVGLPEEMQETRYHYAHHPPDHNYNKRPILPHKRGVRYHSTPIPIVAVPANQGLSEEEEKKQMIFHLNLYPRKKNNFNRRDIMRRGMRADQHKKFIEKVVSPFRMLTKQTDQSAIEYSKFSDTDVGDVPQSLALTKYQESFIEMPNDGETQDQPDKQSTQEEVPENHHKFDLNTVITKKILLSNDQPKNPINYDFNITKQSNEPFNNDLETTLTPTQLMNSDLGVPVLEEPLKNDLEITNDSQAIEKLMVDERKTETTTVSTTTIDVDTIDGFQKFADGLVSTS